MIQSLYRHKTFAAIFIPLGLVLRPLRLCGEIIFSLFCALIISMSLSGVSFAEGPLEKTDISVAQTSEEGAWTGIDVSVVGKYATKYGHPPRDPYINTDQGDLLLFVFTIAGVIGGFVIGFNARKLFYEKQDTNYKSQIQNLK